MYANVSYHKYSQKSAKWDLRPGERFQDYDRNMRILIANGLHVEVARDMAGRLFENEIEHPSAYLKELLRHPENFSQEYLQYLGIEDVPEYEPFDEEETYTTPIKKRLRARALRMETDQLRHRLATEIERNLFWRDDPRRPTGRSTLTPPTP